MASVVNFILHGTPEWHETIVLWSAKQISKMQTEVRLLPGCIHQTPRYQRKMPDFINIEQLRFQNTKTLYPFPRLHPDDTRFGKRGRVAVWYNIMVYFVLTPAGTNLTYYWCAIKIFALFFCDFRREAEINLST